MPHIMLVEGDALVRALIAHRLMDLNWRVTTLKDATDLERHLTDEPADVLVIELGLPQADAFSVVASLRAKGITVPTFITTSRELPHLNEMAVNAGANGLLHKPFNEEELLARAGVLLAA